MNEITKKLCFSKPYSNPYALDDGIYRAFVIFYKNTAIIPPHYHKDLELVIPYGLKGECYIYGKKFVLSNYKVYCIAPNTPHTFIIKPYTGANALIFQINIDHFSDAISRCTGLKGCDIDFLLSLNRIPVEYSQNLGLLKNLIEKLWQLKDDNEINLIKQSQISFKDALNDLEILYKILALIITKLHDGYPKETDKIAKMRKIIDFTESIVNRPLSLAHIISMTGISKSYFYRMFKAWNGITAQTYINELRINRAFHLLLEKQSSITKTGAECGFKSISHFIRLFSESTGLSPKKWLSQNRKMPLFEGIT
ncbi:MAG: helix-turn-helix domain-containing protein [bacterium]